MTEQTVRPIAKIPIQPINKLLIANRGEIACRIIGTARRLGIETALVCSEPDQNSLAATLADQVFVIGPAAANASYLRQEKVIEVARTWQADAVHPGYGFLSENADFATALESAGIGFVGPPASAMASMASKSEAKRLMEQAGVPLLRGYHGSDQSDQTLGKAAEQIGYPVMLKAAAGGGGKGMRIVASADQFQQTLEAARREAEQAFGDTSMLVEQYLVAPRHIEVQIFFDQYGEGVYLFDRDCSIQRRHQKVVEEAPAPDLAAPVRQAMGQAALAAGRAIDYQGAGTVEFLLASHGQGDQFYFMEMNTRLQVEHPVTEMVTGVDLVEWQIRVAEGHPLPLSQQQLKVTGHALEVRLYAEQPAKEFLPATGTVTHLQWPSPSPWLRVETGIRAGDQITPWYDPMIAKLVVHGPDRRQACSRMAKALQSLHITGLATNRDFLLRTIGHPNFVAQVPDTGFIPRYQQTLLATNTKQFELALIAATLCPAEQPTGSYQGWRLHGRRHWYGFWAYQGERYSINVRADQSQSCTALVNDKGIDLDLQRIEDNRVVLNGVSIQVYPEPVRVSHGYRVSVVTPSLTVTLHSPDYTSASGDDQDLTAPMNGRVVAVMASPGQEVAKGEPLLILEAMKMEQTIRAPYGGVVDHIYHEPGSLVEQGVLLISFVTSAGGQEA